MTSFAERSYTWPKWLPKMKALLTLILQHVHVKRSVFTLYQEECFLYVFMGMLSGLTLKLSSEDIPRSMISKANER